MTIELIGVTKFFLVNWRRHFVFRDLSITFPGDKNVAVVGPNGVGKTTLLRMIAGAVPANRGTIIRTRRVSWPLGFGGCVHPKLTGRANARFAARIYGEDPARVEARVDDFAALGDFFDAPVRTYSSGMKARLTFGLSLAIEFDTLLIDELSAVGDQRFKLKSREALVEKRKKGNFLIVTHNLAEVREFCDGVMVLGREGPPSIDWDVEGALARYEEEFGAREMKRGRMAGDAARDRRRRAWARRHGATDDAPEELPEDREAR